MAATLKEILLMEHAKAQRRVGHHKKLTSEGTKIALNISHHYKFPDDDDKDQEEKTK
ncbi:MAG: hypothetical protein V4668_03355 [Patescibacteria group bacterium]